MLDIISQHNTNNFFNDEETMLIKILLDENQQQLFDKWEQPGLNDEKKKDFLKQLLKVNSSYPGGIKSYLNNARTLLQQVKDNVNPFDGFIPEKPDIIDISKLDQKFFEMENIGAANLDKIAIVMVAGGLGERLGYSGIKINIPLEVIEFTSYIKLYALQILAFQDFYAEKNKPCVIPFIIMTSNDTHEKTITSLQDNNYFGLQKDQITILKQELVPALTDNEAHLGLKNPYELQLKPHGHGDIHMLLYTSGTAEKLYKNKKEYLIFIQDTNGQVCNSILPAIGVCKTQSFDFNSIGVSRVPGEAVGAITRLKKSDHELTVNVEYNQLDALLRATVNPAGDAPDEKGLSPFPGNINILFIKISSYLKILEKSKGIIAEFVNPKYTDETKTTFKKPTRLETMMQDLPKLFTKNEKVGVTILDRKYCFSPDKNNISDAAKKANSGQPPESAASAESDYYFINRKKLSLAGVEFEQAEEKKYHNVPFINGSKVIIFPSFAVTVNEIKHKIISSWFSKDSTLILDGKEIYLENLILENFSGLKISVAHKVKITIKNLTLKDEGYKIIPLTENEMQNESIPQYLKIRGYKIEKLKPFEIIINEPGEYLVDKTREIKKIR